MRVVVLMGTGSCSGRVVISDNRGLGFESVKKLLNICLLSTVKNKERVQEWPIFEKSSMLKVCSPQSQSEIVLFCKILKSFLFFTTQLSIAGHNNSSIITALSGRLEVHGKKPGLTIQQHFLYFSKKPYRHPAGQSS